MTIRRGRVNTVKTPTGVTSLTGDVVSLPNGGGGSTTTVIPANTVQFAQLQDMDASAIAGRGSALGAGDIEPISLGAGLEMVGTEMRATGAVLAFDPDLGAYTAPR